MIAIPNTEGIKKADGIGVNIHYEDGHIETYIIGIDEIIDIVTCGECIHRHEHEWYNTCDKHIGHGFEDDYFCKDGERNSKITQIGFEKLKLTQMQPQTNTIENTNDKQSEEAIKEIVKDYITATYGSIDNL